MDKLIADIKISDEQKIKKLENIIRYCNPIEMIKTVAYFWKYPILTGIDAAYKLVNKSLPIDLDKTIVGKIKKIYDNVITPAYIKDTFKNTALDKKYVSEKMTELTCEAVKALSYIGGKIIAGAAHVAEDAIDFAVGTVAKISGHSEFAEKVYKADISGKLSDYIDKRYDGYKFVKDVGKCVEKIGEAGTYIGLSVLSNAVPAITAAAIAAAGAACAGSGTRNAIEKTGEFTSREFMCGVLNVAWSALTMKTTEILCSGIGSVAGMLKNSADKIGNKVISYIAEKAVTFMKGAAVSGINKLNLEYKDIISKYIERLLDIDNETVDWKKIAKETGVSALIGGSFFLAGDVMKDITLVIKNRNSITLENFEDIKKSGQSYKEIKEAKPKNSPNIAKWLQKGGKIKITEQDGNQIWSYVNPEGISVKYIDGYPDFQPEVKHPYISDINIGRFTGDRIEDKRLYLKILEEDYGITEIPKGYALHHGSENGCMQLIKEGIHKEFTHKGGHSEYKGEI